MDAAAVTTQIEDLLKAHAAYMAKEPPYSTAEQIELIVRMEAAIDRLAPRSSRYVKEAEGSAAISRAHVVCAWLGSCRR
jgi:hypothetical protein